MSSMMPRTRAWPPVGSSSGEIETSPQTYEPSLRAYLVAPSGIAELAARDPRVAAQRRVDVVRMGRRQEVEPDQLLLRVPEELAGQAPVGAQHASGRRVNLGDPERWLVEERPEAPLALAQGSLRLLALRDVVHHGEMPACRAGRVREGGHRDLHPGGGAVRAPEPLLPLEVRASAVQEAREGVAGLLQVVGVRERLDVQRAQLVARPTEPLAERRVGAQMRPVSVSTTATPAPDRSKSASNSVAVSRSISRSSASGRLMRGLCGAPGGPDADVRRTSGKWLAWPGGYARRPAALRRTRSGPRGARPPGRPGGGPWLRALLVRWDAVLENGRKALGLQPVRRRPAQPASAAGASSGAAVTHRS